MKKIIKSPWNLLWVFKIIIIYLLLLYSLKSAQGIHFNRWTVGRKWLPYSFKLGQGFGRGQVWSSGAELWSLSKTIQSGWWRTSNSQGRMCLSLGKAATYAQQSRYVLFLLMTTTIQKFRFKYQNFHMIMIYSSFTILYKKTTLNQIN